MPKCITRAPKSPLFCHQCTCWWESTKLLSTNGVPAVGFLKLNSLSLEWEGVWGWRFVKALYLHIHLSCRRTELKNPDLEQEFEATPHLSALPLGYRVRFFLSLWLKVCLIAYKKWERLQGTFGRDWQSPIPEQSKAWRPPVRLQMWILILFHIRQSRDVLDLCLPYPKMGYSSYKAVRYAMETVSGYSFSDRQGTGLRCLMTCILDSQGCLPQRQLLIWPGQMFPCLSPEFPLLFTLARLGISLFVSFLGVASFSIWLALCTLQAPW